MVKEAEKYLQLLDKEFYKSYGKVSTVVGLTVESLGPKARLNDLCKIYVDKSMSNYVMAEVVGFQDSKLILMPVDSVEGVGVGCIVENTGKPLEVIMRDTERDNFMSAAEAAEYGLIDKVITKR